MSATLSPFRGYVRATEVARTALYSGRRVHDLVLESGHMTKVELDEILQPDNSTRPRPVTQAGRVAAAGKEGAKNG